MIQRLTALLIAVAALLAFSAPSALAQPAQPNPAGDVPQGFPADLKRFVGGTPEFKDGPWFHDPDCVNKGGNVAMYINAVMQDEPRLLYWSAPPQARTLMWGTLAGDPNKEPPELPRTFPASAADRDAYHLSENYCADELRTWSNPADNAWGFTWAPGPDPDSLEAMKPYAASADDPDALIHLMAKPCGNTGSPFCQKAFFVDCGKTLSNPDMLKRCTAWNASVANLFAGMAHYIDQHTSWADKIGQFFGAVGTAVVIGGKALVDAFMGILGVAVEIAKFVVNPAGAVDDLANALHQSATDLTAKVLQGLAASSKFDPSAPWFLQAYAASAGIGIAVMALCAVLMIIRTARGSGGREELQESLFKNLPLGLFLAVFAPGIATFLGQITDALTDGIATWQAGSLNSAVAKLALIGTVTAAAVPGGVIIGIIIFLLMVIGAFSMFVGLAMQSVALPFAGFVAGIAWGMWVHPKQRKKALRVPMTYGGVLAAKPVTFLLIGFGFKAIDGNASIPALKSGGIPLLTQLVFIIVILLIMGLAPFSLLKYFPLLPTAADSMDSQPSSGFGTASTVGASVGALADRHRTKGATQQDAGKRSIAQTYESGPKPPATASPARPQPGTAGARLSSARPKTPTSSPTSRGAAQAASSATVGNAASRLLGFGREPGKAAGLARGAAEAARVSAAPGAPAGSAAARLHGAGPAPRPGGAQVLRGGPAAVQALWTRTAAAATSAATSAGDAPAGQGSGGEQPGGFLAATARSASGLARTPANAGALGALTGMASGPWGVAANAGVAAFNRLRTAAHSRHGAELDLDPAQRSDN
ncbi:hypothetical protein ACIA5G_39900 [Amycolatopsis sp. NPDC051758]|uniref:hypothetical protein n=1 Tax=Amycolatopsis sp. NPDC051758 TaxID=3363935 RepID=UPI00378A9104